MSSFGAGLLIGAALIVIIPEGVELLMKEGESQRERGGHRYFIHSGMVYAEIEGSPDVCMVFFRQ